eukprot:3189883-Rhodomonas_salina.3
MPGTEGAKGAMRLRARNAMPGTDEAYGATQHRAAAERREVGTPLSAYELARQCPRVMLCACYAISGTDVAYGTTTRLTRDIVESLESRGLDADEVGAQI